MDKLHSFCLRGKKNAIDAIVMQLMLSSFGGIFLLKYLGSI